MTLRSPNAPRPLAHLPGEILQASSTPSSECRARFLDLAQELRMILKPVLEPVILGFETDQHAGGPAVTGDQNLAIGRES